MSVDPKWPFWIGLVTTVALVASNGAMWTDLVPATWAPKMAAGNNLVGTVGTALLTFLSGQSSSMTGPLVK